MTNTREENAADMAAEEAGQECPVRGQDTDGIPFKVAAMTSHKAWLQINLTDGQAGLLERGNAKLIIVPIEAAAPVEPEPPKTMFKLFFTEKKTQDTTIQVDVEAATAEDAAEAAIAAYELGRYDTRLEEEPAETSSCETRVGWRRPDGVFIYII
jgi:hypothetical protein